MASAFTHAFAAVSIAATLTPDRRKLNPQAAATSAAAIPSSIHRCRSCRTQSVFEMIRSFGSNA
jgi:hypothetical protein